MATVNQLSSQVTAMHRELQAMRGTLDRMAEALALETSVTWGVRDTDDGTFVPGTGTLGASSTAAERTEANLCGNRGCTLAHDHDEPCNYEERA